MFLRLLSLGGKLALSLFMGAFFSLAELGVYGLAFGAVMLAVVLFGFRIDYTVSREIAGMPPERQRDVGMQVIALFLISFVLAALPGIAILMYFGLPGGIGLALLIYALCCVEAFANYLYTVTISLKRPAFANGMFFIRSGLWPIPVMIAAFFVPELRNVAFVLGAWLAGVSISVVLNLVFMRDTMLRRPAGSHLRMADVGRFCRSTAMIWIGSVAVAMGIYLDRFVLARVLSLSDVGVATFYISFTLAALTLVQSATTSVTLPAMIDRYDRGDIAGFRSEVRRTAKLAITLAVAVMVGLAAVMLAMGPLLGKPELSAAYPAFLLLLLATLIRTHSETLYYGLFVQRRHRSIWLGNLVFFGLALVFNFALIPLFGLIGLGLAAVLSTLAIMAIRWLAYRREDRPALSENMVKV